MSESELEVSTVVRRSEEVLFSRIDDELIAIDADAGYCYSLNESAARIWELLEAPSSAQTVCASLCAEYMIDEATCLDDVMRAFADLRHTGLIVATVPPV